MPRQKGPVHIIGTLGDQTFYVSNGIPLVRKKSNLNKERVLKDPSFANSRKSSKEFGEANSVACALIRAFAPIVKETMDATARTRLIARMIKMLETDSVNVKGERRISNSDLSLLNGFEFNAKTPFGSFMNVPVDIVQTTDGVHVTIRGIGKNAVKKFKGCTHFKIRSALLKWDFRGDLPIAAFAETLMLKIDNVASESAELLIPNHSNAEERVVLLLNINYGLKTGDTVYPLANRSRSGSMVRVI